MRIMLRGRLGVFIAIAIVGLGAASAAGQQTGDQKPVDITGAYKLIATDGRDLPTTVGHEGQPGPTVTAGTLTLNKDATFVSSMSVTMPDGQTMTANRKGTYTKDGTTLDMAWENAGHTKTTVDGPKLTMNNEGLLWVFKKAPTASGVIDR